MSELNNQDKKVVAGLISSYAKNKIEANFITTRAELLALRKKWLTVTPWSPDAPLPIHERAEPLHKFLCDKLRKLEGKLCEERIIQLENMVVEAFPQYQI